MFTLLTAAVALAAPVPKPANAELKWRFAKGDTVYVKTEIENVANINAGGGGGAAVQGTASGAEYEYKLTVTAADEKGATLEVEFLACKSGNAAGLVGVKMEDQKGVVGKKVTVTLDPANKVTKLDGADKLGGPGMAGGMLGEEYLKYNLDDLIRAVPGKPLGKNDTWTGEEEFAMTEGIAMKRSDRGSVAGTEDGLTKLEVETDHTMSGGPKNGGVTMDLKGEKGKRTILFDPKAGRVRKVTEEYSMAGTVGIGGGGGAAQNIQMSMTLKATITVSDDKPKDK
jgi:hypothetical protein